MLWPQILMLVVAAIAAVIDYRTGLIPNWLTLPTLGLVPFAFLLVSPFQAGLSILGILICGFVPYMMFRRNALGGGDVKLFAALGALGGVTLGLEVMLFSLSVAVIIAVALLTLRGQLRSVLANVATMILNGFRPASRRVAIQATQLHSFRLAPAIFLGTVWAIGALYV